MNLKFIVMRQWKPTHIVVVNIDGQSFQQKKRRGWPKWSVSMNAWNFFSIVIFCRNSDHRLYTKIMVRRCKNLTFLWL